MQNAPNTLVFNTTAMKHATLAAEIDIARKAGYAGIETTAAKVQAYLDAGFSVEDLKAELDGIPIYGLGTIVNIERHGADLEALLDDARRIFALANLVGARGVQVINGPLDYREVVRFQEGKPAEGFRGVLDCDAERRLEITAANLALLSDMAAEFGIIVYLEALGWSPLNTLAHQKELLRRANRPNLRIVVDFWHCFVSGDTAADVAALDKDSIYGVHLDDALPHDGSVPNEVVLRDVPTGEGVLDLAAWVAAVKATGYDDWWCSETFCRKIQQTNPAVIVPQMRAQLADLVLGTEAR